MTTQLFQLLTLPRPRNAQTSIKPLILVIRYVTFNFLAKPFNNLAICQAFALAVNKNLLATTIAHGAVNPKVISCLGRYVWL